MTLRIVAVALVTQEELNRLGTAFRRAYPIEDGPCFCRAAPGDLLAAPADTLVDCPTSHHPVNAPKLRRSFVA